MRAIAFAVTCLLALSGVVAAESCYKSVGTDCAPGSKTLGLANCNALYGEYGRHGKEATELKAYANLHLERSYEYLLSASYFNNYKTNRGGFSKLFRKLSDDAWEKTIELIKHVTMRGDKMDFVQRSTYDKEASQTPAYVVEVQELEALAKALDTQKELAERAFDIHREAVKTNPDKHDPEVAQYLEEEFIEKHAKTIRNLAGHTNDLKNFMIGKGHDLSLALYIFDEYLKKTV